MRLVCIDIAADFQEGLLNFFLLFDVPFELTSFEDCTWNLASSDIVLLMQTKPGDELKAASRIIDIRKSVKTCSTPFLLVTEAYSPAVKALVEHQEFLWTTHFPFDAVVFLKQLFEIKTFLTAGSKWMMTIRGIRSALEANNFKGAARLLTDLEKSYPYPFHLKMLSGDVYHRLGKLDKAELFYVSARDLNPASVEVHNRLAAIYSQTNRDKDLGETIADAAKAADVYVQNLIQMGHDFMEKGDISSSKTAFEDALEKEPGSTQAKEGLLVASLISGDSVNAQLIIKDSPYTLELARLCNFKGITLAKAGQYDSAEKLYRNALNFLPDQTVAYKLWFNLGLCMKNMGHWKKALESFEKAKKNAPKDFKKVDPYIDDAKKFLADQALAPLKAKA